MGWSSGSELAHEVIKAAWPGVKKLKAKERRKFLGTVVEAFENRDAEFCWPDFEDESYYKDLRAYAKERGDWYEEDYD